MWYSITKNNMLVGITYENVYELNLPADFSIHEFEDNIVDLNTFSWDLDTETFIAKTGILSKLQFLNKFTMYERIALRSSTDPIIIDIMKIFEVAEYIDKADEKTINSLQYFVLINLLSAERMTEILS